MAGVDELTPKQAAHIATNSYFALKDWIHKEPQAGVESRANLANRVTGPASVGSPTHANTSLQQGALAHGQLHGVHTATTGFGTSSGFGYTLTYEGAGRKHVVIATRGTRPEMPGKPDLITDLRGTMTSFGDYGPVHKGFKKTFDSIIPSLNKDSAQIMGADVVHCVGHSLGGAVATLIAAHYAAIGKRVKLYTFGSPRVGCFNTYDTLQSRIGESNIYRVAHDLDPISLIGPFPFIHVQPKATQSGNMTLLSPTGRLISTANHDMVQYINSVGRYSWEGVRRRAALVDHDNALVARWLLHEDNDPGWVQYASAKTLAILFKLFNWVLKGISTSLILGLSAIDLLVEVLMKGLNRIRELGSQVSRLLRYAAKWAGIKIEEGADFSASIVRKILNKMLRTLQNVASTSIDMTTRNINPLAIGIAGALLLTTSNAL